MRNSSDLVPVTSLRNGAIGLPIPATLDPRQHHLLLASFSSLWAQIYSTRGGQEKGGVLPRSCEWLCTQPALQPASTDVPQKPLPSRCFLEKGSCGHKWLFPAGSCMLELTQGSEKARRKGLYLFVRLI